MTQDKLNDGKQQHSVDLLDVLLDKHNRDPITLKDPTGKEIDFEQVAVIPQEINGRRFLFVILKPLDIPGVADDEAIVFRADIDARGNTVLALEEDESVAIAVFNEYYDLIEAEHKAKRRKK